MYYLLFKYILYFCLLLCYSFVVIGGEIMKNRLRELREEKGLTLNELSNELLKRLDFKIGSNALGKYERGEREPRLNTWAKLADFSVSLLDTYKVRLK